MNLAMNLLEAVLGEPLLVAIGLALIHFIWQGALVALLLAMVLRLLGDGASEARYRAACAALLLVSLLPPLTVAINLRSSPPAARGSDLDTRALPGQVRLPLEAEPESRTAPAAAAAPRGRVASGFEQLSSGLGSMLPWMVALWLAGVAFFSLRLFGGWLYAERLRGEGARLLDTSWQLVVRRLEARLRVRRGVRLLASTLVKVPTAVGWLRPVILLPVGVIAGLSPAQLEAIIAHELAHIRRHDYLVNLWQAVVETLLFYHPAVWWLSRRIRIEREHCCDDLAVAACGNALVYARALVEIEQLRAAAPQLPKLGMAANGGLLMQRIHRLVAAPAPRTNRIAGLAVGLVAGLLALTAVAGASAGAQMLFRPAAKESVKAALAAAGEPAASPGLSVRGLLEGGSQPGLSGLSGAGGARPEPQPRPEAEPSPDGRQMPRPGERTMAVNAAATVAAAGEATTFQEGSGEKIRDLASEAAAVRAAAACELGRRGALEAIPALINLLGDDTLIEPQKCWSGGGWSPAKDVFRQSSPGEAAAIALASLGQAAVEPLIWALGDSRASVRRNAAWALGEVRGGSGTDRGAAVEPLIVILGDHDVWVRRAAAFALGELRPEQATESLIAALVDSEERVREMAAWALGEMKARQATESLGALLLRDENGAVRRTAAWALGEIADPRSLDALTVALADQNQAVRASVKRAIAEIRD